MTDVARYAWVETDEEPWSPAACMTAIVGMSAKEVLSSFGVEHRARTVAVEDATASARPTVGVGTLDGGVIAVEFNGFQGSRPEVIGPLSMPANAASAFWNVNAVTNVSLAREGRVLSSFEARIGAQRSGDQPGVADAFVADLDFERPRACMLAVVERFTGLRATASILDSITRLHVITPLIASPHRNGKTDWAAWAGSPMAVNDAELAISILAATPAQQREFALWAATEALTAAEIHSEPAVIDSVETLRQGYVGPITPATAKFISDTNAEAERLGRLSPSGSHPPTRAAWKRAAALAALHAAASDPESDSAAVTSAAKARLTFWDRQPDFLTRAKRHLAR